MNLVVAETQNSEPRREARASCVNLFLSPHFVTCILFDGYLVTTPTIEGSPSDKLSCWSLLFWSPRAQPTKDQNLALAGEAASSSTFEVHDKNILPQ